MSSGCIPDRNERMAILQEVKSNVARAQELLLKIKDPDKSVLRLEEAYGHLLLACGEEYPDRNDIDPNNGKGLCWLMEHYLS